MTADGTYFYVDSYINTNTNNDGNKLLNGHLFRFTTKSNGTLKAVEVDEYVAADNVCLLYTSTRRRAGVSAKKPA